MSTPLSVVIITFNEERNIKRCIDSVLKITDDIVIWDSFSNDRTKDICEQLPVRFFQAAWEGYSTSKNKATDQARYDWVLSLDADEALSEELINAIIELQKEGMQPAAFARLTNYCGHWVRYGGWYPDIKWRIFNRKQVEWVGRIHESLQWKNQQEQQSTRLLKGDCLHYSFYHIEEHYRQAEKFVTLMAEERFKAGKKTNNLKMLGKPVVRFLRDYFLKAGFLDGKAGWQIAKVSAHAVYLREHKLKQFWKAKQS